MPLMKGWYVPNFYSGLKKIIKLHQEHKETLSRICSKDTQFVVFRYFIFREKHLHATKFCAVKKERLDFSSFHLGCTKWGEILIFRGGDERWYLLTFHTKPKMLILVPARKSECMLRRSISNKITPKIMIITTIAADTEQLLRSFSGCYRKRVVVD